VLRSPRDSGPERFLLARDQLLHAFHAPDLRAVEEQQDGDHDRQHHQHDRQRHHEPLEEGDRLAGLLLDELAADQVGRGADRQQQAADRDPVGDHQHHRSAEAQALRVARAIGLRGDHRPDRRHDPQRDRHHHRGRRGVGHERRGDRAHRAEGKDDPHGRVANPAHSEHPEREAPVQPVHDHRLGDDEGADEQQDRRVGEAAEDVVGRRLAFLQLRHRFEQRGQADPQQGGDRDRDRLADPPDNDEREDRRQPVLIAVEVERQQQDHDEQHRAQHQADVAAQPFEALLGRRQLARLLVERPIGERSARSLLDVLRGSHRHPLLETPLPEAGTPGNG
jgi:hypothetical protein